MKPHAFLQLAEANKLIAEFMDHHPYVDRYHISWDALMPVITKIKSIDSRWLELCLLIDDIDNALACCSSIRNVHHYTVLAIKDYYEYKGKNLDMSKYEVTYRTRESSVKQADVMGAKALQMRRDGIA